MYEKGIQVIEVLKSGPKTIEELVEKLPEIGKNNIHSEITFWRKKNAIARVDKKYQLTPAFKKQNDIR